MREIVDATRDNIVSLADWMSCAEDIDWSYDQLVEVIDNPRYLLRIAVDRSGEMISGRSTVSGFALGHFTGDECTLMMMAVHAPARRQGLARLLLNDLVSLAIKRDMEHIFLEVRESNAAALSLYRNSGFVQQGKRPDYYPARVSSQPREAALLMQLNLNSPADE